MARDVGAEDPDAGQAALAVRMRRACTHLHLSAPLQLSFRWQGNHRRNVVPTHTSELCHESWCSAERCNETDASAPPGEASADFIGAKLSWPGRECMRTRALGVPPSATTGVQPGERDSERIVRCSLAPPCSAVQAVAYARLSRHADDGVHT
jgi:hypothetical protein